MFLTICQAWHKVRKLSANNGQKSPRKKSEHIRKTFSSHSPYNPLLKPQLSSIYLELMKVTYCYIYYLCKISNLTTYWCPWLWRRCSPCQEFSEHTRIRHRQRSARAHATWYIKKICEWCGSKFTARKATTRFCFSALYRIAHISSTGRSFQTELN